MLKTKSKKQSEKKRFIVRKYIMACSAVDAIKQEKKFKVDDVFVDSDWKEKNEVFNSSKIGFKK